MLTPASHVKIEYPGIRDISLMRSLKIIHVNQPIDTILNIKYKSFSPKQLLVRPDQELVNPKYNETDTLRSITLHLFLVKSLLAQ
jgi:hypothetical protein